MDSNQERKPHEVPCPDCGARRRPTAACDTCGAPPDRTAAPVTDTTDPLTDPLIDRPTGPLTDHPAERSAGGSREQTDDDRRPETTPADTASGTTTLQGPPSDPVAPDPVAPDDVERARALLLPVADGEEQDPQITPVMPGRPRPAPLPVNTPRPPAEEGEGVPCPWCSTMNSPHRHFCRRCTMSLDGPDADEGAPSAWWRRILEPDGRQAPRAGERPRLRAGFGRRLRIAAAIIIAVTIVWVGIANAERIGNGVVDHFAKPVTVRPGLITASSSDPQHGPQQAADGLNDVFWGVGVGGNGHGHYLDASFGQPIRLLYLLVTPGVSTRPDRFATQARPQNLKVTAYSSDGSTTVRDIQLDDTPGPQRFALRAPDVVRVRLTIRSAYGAAPARQVAIAEVEFFTRSRKTLG